MRRPDSTLRLSQNSDTKAGKPRLSLLRHATSKVHLRLKLSACRGLVRKVGAARLLAAGVYQVVAGCMRDMCIAAPARGTVSVVCLQLRADPLHCLGTHCVCSGRVAVSAKPRSCFKQQPAPVPFVGGARLECFGLRSRVFTRCDEWTDD